MIVAVYGKGRDCPKDVYDDAVTVGRYIAEGGHVLVTGGLGGVMEAAAKGARECGGFVVGILPYNWKGNKYLSLAIRTGLSVPTRNVVNGACADMAIGMWGGHGTLQELCLAMDRDIPVAAVATDKWESLNIPQLVVEEVPGWLISLRP